MRKIRRKRKGCGSFFNEVKNQNTDTLEDLKVIKEQEEKFLKMNIRIIILVTVFYGVLKLIGGMIPLVIGIGLALVALVIVFLVLYKLNVSFYIRALVITTFQLLLIFAISTSGTALYDDYILYLASAAMCGIYFKPSYVVIQTILADLFLLYNFILNPEKLGESSQAILCIVCLNLTLMVIFLLVKRGESYIKQAQEKAEKTEELLEMVAGKVWICTISENQLREYEEKLQIVSLRNESNGKISVRYLSEKAFSKDYISEDSISEDSISVEPRLEDLYLWLFPQEEITKEEE